jgi:hypothetical protein
MYVPQKGTPKMDASYFHPFFVMCVRSIRNNGYLIVEVKTDITHLPEGVR